jgi:hypothetical protein
MFCGLMEDFIHYCTWSCDEIQHLCRNPSLGLATKARGYKVAGQEGDPGVTSHAPGSAKSVRE